MPVGPATPADVKRVLVLVYALVAINIFLLSSLGALTHAYNALQTQMQVSRHRSEVTIAIIMGAMLSHRGLRRQLGNVQIWNSGLYEAVLLMIAHNPDQFRKVFRMHPATFFDLEADLWRSMYPQAPPLSELHSNDPAIRTAARKRRWVG